MEKQQHVHFIGIAGKGTAPVAVMMKKLGWKVTGSDIDVFEPMLSYLKNKGITEWQEGFDASRIAPADLVVIGGGMLMKNANNPEFLEAKRLGKKLVGFEYLLRTYVAKKISIIMAGTYGKTSSSALMIWVLKQLGVNPSYFTGGVPIDYPEALEATESDYSIFEGDEYASVWGYDMEPKFIYYNATHTMITAAKWDHVNIYPSIESYIHSYEKLIDITYKNNGVLLLCASGEHNEKLLAYSGNRAHTYYLEGMGVVIPNAEYVGKLEKTTEDAFYFSLRKGDKVIGNFQTKLLGLHNVENCVGVIAMCDLLGLDLEKVGAAIASFSGVKVRLELLGKTPKGATVFNDFAHSPVKAQASLDALRMRFPTKKIVSIFDPHASTLADPQSLSWYAGAFDKASEVIIPRVQVKKSTPKDMRVYGKDIVEAIQKTQPNAAYYPLDEQLITYLQSLGEDSVIAFMSSGGWRGLIEQLGIKP